MPDKRFIEITDKSRCSGCTACSSVCPKNCIFMQEDGEGFLYPKVDVSTCIQCGKCVKVCPYTNSEFTNKPETDELALCYAAYNKDEEIRYKSSSGGMFRAFADFIISEGGVVFGVRFDDKFLAEHAYSETSDGLSAFMGSKYMQSRVGDSFAQVKRFLEDGRKVLFTGCGCQIAGLKRFLKHDHENLICIDLICHGANSPMIWQEYLHSLFPDETIEHINMRDKVTGQENSSIFIKGCKSTFCDEKKNSIYFRNWRYGLFVRPSCETCPFKADNRVSDITIADCWGYRKIAPEMFDDKGLSSVIIHTARGKALFETVSPQLAYKETSLEDVKTYNDYIRSTPFNHKKRNEFWKDYHKHSIPFDKLLNKYLKTSRMQKTMTRIKKAARALLSLKNIQIKQPRIMLEADRRFNETFRFGGKKMPLGFKRQPEWKFITVYRRFQANKDNVLGIYYRLKLARIERQTGIHVENNPNIGRGLIIGHYGRIIINGSAKFGEQIYITHGVTIGRNSTGKKKGAPVIGNRVRIGANATIVGNVHIGNDVMIAPNAFVNIDVPDHSVVIGNPCVIHHKENATKGYLGEID